MAGSLGTRGTGHTNGTTRNITVPAHNIMDQERGTRTTQPEMAETSGKFSSLKIRCLQPTTTAGKVWPSRPT